ncbi:MAG TPA: M48 family metallopeptidase [Burkholderiaceae bacterium]|nr:M48 family metallopeptidase [Burkholderiaceae bacterium]
MFAGLFVFMMLLTYAMQLWLARRQARHVIAHRDVVPPEFADKVSLEAHRKAADYTLAKLQVGFVDRLLGWVVVLGFTLLGGLNALNLFWLNTLGPGIPAGIALITSVVVISAAIDLPLQWWSTFKVEERFGFNRMTTALWITDLVKGAVVFAVIGLPLVAAVLWLMRTTGDMWWLWAWGVVVGFQALVFMLYPTVIAPLFNKFEPLADASLKTRIDDLLKRCGFRAKGLFVMDGSKRSAHGNAYFTGMGSSKRVVFFDTLIERLTPTEVEAVLAHELGHFKLRHIWKRVGMSMVIALAGLVLLGWLSQQTWFYLGLGVAPRLDAPNDAVALVLFVLALPAFTFPFSPLMSRTSRKHEFEADAFAAQQADAKSLASALVKLYEDNATTLTPDPLYSAFYHSHPPARQRLARLQTVAA